jgi:hypothetical protein
MFDMLIRSSLVLLAGLTMQVGSCIALDVPGIPNPPGNNGSQIGSDELRIRLINDTDWAVDVQLYAARTTGDPDAVLFEADNKITAGIGFAGQGFIPAHDADEVVLEADAVAMLGTLGGEFLDEETGESVGAGHRRILTRSLQYLGGDTITFIFHGDTDDFGTSVVLD